MEKATGTGRHRVVLALAASILAHGAAAAVLVGWDRLAPGSPSIGPAPGEMIAVTIVLEAPAAPPPSAEPAGSTVAEAAAPPEPEPPAETAVAELPPAPMEERPEVAKADPEPVAAPTPRPKPKVETPLPKPVRAAAPKPTPKPVRSKPERKAVETAALTPAVSSPAARSAPGLISPVPGSPSSPEASGRATQPTDGPNEGGGSAALSPDYLADVLAWIERHKRYPRQARLRREQGAVVLAFTIDRSGRVLSSAIRRSSGSAALDTAATEMIERASPLPPLPVQIAQSHIEMVVPVRFALR